uniref:GGDEF domain-containing protein n=1 Tax=Suilimivivens sp. TaxID=2981669 RepID=UPI00307C7CB4
VSDQWLNAKKELLISEYRANHDIMTGLWNKTSGVAKVRNCLENMSEGDMAVLGFMDIDNFKSVNDTYGHETGDFWIREVASALQEMCGPSDIACRYGGDEYILFLQNIKDRDELTARIEGFRKKIHDKAEEKGQDVHCSIGLYQVKGAGRQLAECIIIADGLLYQAKKNGKDTYVIE